MKQIRIDDIELGSRHRQDMGELQPLSDSMDELGLLQPIGITPDCVLIFGERRLKAAELLGWETIAAVTVDIPAIVLGEYAENEIRKDFAPSERVAIGQAVEILLGKRQGQRTDLEHTDNGPGVGETRNLAAGRSGFNSGKQYERAKSVTEQGIPDLVTAMDSGTASISAAAEVARLDADEQSEIVARGEKEIVAAAKKIRAERSEQRRQERVAMLNEAHAGSADLETGRRYNVILADPPWRYEHAVSTSREIENQYPTMDLDAICDLPVGGVAADDCVLFLWATSPKLAEAMRVIESWGFDYRTCLVWVKDKIGMGYYARQQHELLLVAAKGSVPAPEPATRPASVISAPRSEHSRKPAVVHEIIAGMYPELAKIELFARRPVDGWDAWGNQAT